MSENYALFDPSGVSNFSSNNSFVIQAWDHELTQWLDTIHGAVNLMACLTYAVPRALEPHRWMGGKPGKIRVVRRKSPKR